MTYLNKLDYERSLIRDVFIFFDDYIEELENLIVEHCKSIDDMFATGEFDAHFIDPLFDELDVEDACQILKYTWDEETDTSLWRDERDPDMQRIVKASYTYGKNLYETMCSIYDEIRDTYEKGVAEKGYDGDALSLFAKAYAVVKET
jgi:hypothetical protein